MSIQNGISSRVDAIHNIEFKKLRQNRGYVASAVAMSGGIVVVKLTEYSVATNWELPLKRKVTNNPWGNQIASTMKCLLALKMITQDQYDTDNEHRKEADVRDDFRMDESNLKRLGEKYSFTPTPIFLSQAMSWPARRAAADKLAVDKILNRK